MKKRHLRDLYVRGTVHTIDDGDGEPESVFLKKLNLNENEEAVRLANAERSSYIAASRDPSSQKYKDVLAEVYETDRDILVDYLIAEPLAKHRESVEAEISANPEWEKDNYLQGLHDAWNKGLRDKYHLDNEDEEASKVFAELRRFAEEVDTVIEGYSKSLKAEYDGMSDEELNPKATEQLLKNQADMAWVDCYRKAELLFAVRDVDDHKERLFESLADIDELETETFLNLLRAYREMNVEPQEGKDSPETPSS